MKNCCNSPRQDPFRNLNGATTLLPERAKLGASVPIMACPIPQFFPWIARRGSAQIGAGLNS